MGRRCGRVVLAGLLLAGCTGGIMSMPVSVPPPYAADLTGELYRPAGAGPFPALVLLHGCSGPQPNGREWALWLQGEGYAVLALDSFAGRGLHRLCSESSALTGGARAGDVFAAAAALARRPDIDRARIGAIGFSHGGWSVLWASWPRPEGEEVRLRALVAFYPTCAVPSLGVGTPLLMLLGGQDDWTPPERCRQLAQEARQQGGVVIDVLYPGARHGFDGSHIRRRTVIADARGGRGATVEYDPAAHEDATKQLRRFLRQYLRS
jgi:dienelactone hydrolase